MECDVFVPANLASTGLTFSHYLIRGGVDRRPGGQFFIYCVQIKPLIPVN